VDLARNPCALVFLYLLHVVGELLQLLARAADLDFGQFALGNVPYYPSQRIAPSSTLRGLERKLIHLISSLREAEFDPPS